MKRAIFLWLVFATLSAPIAVARDLKTVNGDVYKNITVRTREATGIQVMHDDGVAFVDFKNMTESDQKEFGYNADAYAEGWKQKFEAEKKRREAAEIAAQQAAARARALATQQAEAQETWQPANQTGLQVTVDSPGFTYGGYATGGWIIPGFPVGPVGRWGHGVVAPNGVYNGATWGPVEIRRR